nr:MAG TPA: hypothetical protein [Caudoviricetes sp.]
MCSLYDNLCITNDKCIVAIDKSFYRCYNIGK